MTDREQKSIDALNATLRQIQETNNQFRGEVTKLVSELSAKVDKKHTPIQFENDILSSVQAATAKAIQEALAGYNSPITKLTALVIDEHKTELKTLISDSFTKVIRTDDFKASIVSAFSHKVAKTIISNNDGLFDKVSNELKQDAVFKSKMTVAVSTVVEECLRGATV